MSDSLLEEYSATFPIDNSDYHRIGGPGTLPPGPVMTDCAGATINSELEEAAVDIATSRLVQYNLSWDKVFLCSRATEGHTPSPSDTTVLIRAPFENQHEKLVSLLNDMIQTLRGLGFNGRVEIIDPRAKERLKDCESWELQPIYW